MAAAADQPLPPLPLSKKPSAIHIPALDGVRGLAVLMVMIFHFALIGGNSPIVRVMQKTSGFGWAGVDLFFVLSGFLITGILWDAKSSNSYFRSFYARRTVRIFPLYFLFLAIMLLLLPAVYPRNAEIFGVPPCGQWAYWTYLYNFAQGHHPPNFSHSLGVVWSLCIEEQFYVIWPAVVYLCSSARTLLKICSGLVIISLLARLLLVSFGFGEVPTTQWSFCRMEGLATGAAIALILRVGDLRPLIKPAWWLLVLVPLITIGLNAVGGSLAQNKIYRVVGPTTLAGLFGSLLLIIITAGTANPAASAMARFFSMPVMRMFGRYSYSMYLFNQPVRYVLGEYVFDPDKQGQLFGSKIPAQVLFTILGTIVTLAIAMLTWHLFEKHFLKLKVLFPMDERHRHEPHFATASAAVDSTTRQTMKQPTADRALSAAS